MDVEAGSMTMGVNPEGELNPLLNDATEIKIESGIKIEDDGTVNKICANPSCQSNLKELVPVQTCCEVYYQLHTNQRQSDMICVECLTTAEKFREECINCMKEGRTLLDVPLHKNSDQGESQGLAKIKVEDVMIEMSVSKKEIASLVNDMLVSNNLQSQLQLCRQKIASDIDNIVQDYGTIEEQIRQMEIEVDRARNMYYESRPTFYDIVKMKALDIDQYGRAITVNEEQPSDNEGPRKPMSVDSSPNNQKRISSEGEKEETTEIQEVNWVTTPAPSKRVLFETPAKIPKVMPKVGDKVYAMKRTALCGWTLGEVDEVIQGSAVKPTMFKIKFSIKKRKFANEADTYSFKELNAKQLAYNIPCPFVLPVGTRIIGLFKDDCAVDEGVTPQDSMYYAGIVAEPPKNTNKYRYLIFFDDGYAQYVEPTEVLLVCESSNPVWADVHPDSQEFIKQYVQKYPERPMVRLTEGTVLSTEWSGKWLLSRVVEVDCSLAKMHFQSENRFEWIYRGSTRLSPLYESERRNAVRTETNALTPSSKRRLPRTNRESNVTIEYLYGNEDAFQDKLRAVAKKSTTQTSTVQKSQSSESLNSGPRKPPSGIPSHSFMEFEGKMAKITLPSGVPVPKEYTDHECGPACVIDFDESNPEFRKLNPLAIVFYLGWGRELAKYPRRHVFYRTPCGLRLKDFRELHQYLLETNFSLSIDHFTFDQNVDCLSEFQASRILFRLQDISYGKEVKPVQAINSLDHDYPDYVEYTSERIRGKGVPLELDPDFLVCCDCTDDCQDKLKCACWNLTYEGYRKTREVKDLDEIGYSYRRLNDHIVSGIYECNVRCKCRKTCLNRVAQNKMKWILQVFKTTNKGWAIRPLHDIPEGSFICVYAGQILTEQGANEDGKNFGDEYLAELDFIEVCEKYKEGYEESCVDPEASFIDLVDEDNKNQGAYDSTGRVDDEDSNDGSRRQPSRFTAKPTSEIQLRRKPRVDPDLSTRDYYKEGEQCFIMDAKSIGNIGRYLNHCCSPNVYVQNVFVDTHDARFPWVAFFAYKTIRAGTEMTWDYNYDIGSVPEKTLYCQCGSPDCRGRLL